jgi:two-component system chemotaxis response regulator CheB
MADTVRARGAATVRVMVVDDSAVVRGLITRMLREDPNVEVVHSASNGEMAVAAGKRDPVDVVVLDIEMPVMDGLAALPGLLAAMPGVQIIMASTLTDHNADISLRALQAGAADYIPKPSTSQGLISTADFRRDLLAKVLSLGAAARASAHRRDPGRGAEAAVARPRPRESAVGQKAEAQPKSLYAHAGPVVLRKPGMFKPKVLVVGSSTGGPQALFSFFKGLKRDIGVPVLLTQHMPPTFTALLGEHIQRSTGWPAREGKDGDALVPGEILIAPGNHHMVVEKTARGIAVRINQGPPENFCRPAVDPMFRSAATAFGGHVLALVLTGMGQDGLVGARAIVSAGGTVVAQDEATSVVWGMPGAVATNGLCSAVLPLAELPDQVRGLAMRGSS